MNGSLCSRRYIILFLAALVSAHVLYATPLLEYALLIKGERAVTSVALSPVTGELATGGLDGTVHCITVATKRVSVLSNHTRSVQCVAYSPDGRYLASGSHDTRVALVDLSRASTRFSSYDTNRVKSLAFSPDSKALLIATRKNGIYLFPVASFGIGDPPSLLRRTVNAHTLTCAFSPNGAYFVTGGSDRTVRIWRWNAYLEHTLRRHRHWVNAVAFAPDSSRFITGGSDKQIRMWDVSGKHIQRIRAHNAWVTALAYAHAGTQFASGSGEGEVAVFNAKGEKRATYPIHTHTVTGLAFSGNDDYLISGSLDGTLRVTHLADGNVTTIITLRTGGFFAYTATAYTTAPRDVTEVRFVKEGVLFEPDELLTRDDALLNGMTFLAGNATNAVDEGDNATDTDPEDTTWDNDEEDDEWDDDDDGAWDAEGDTFRYDNE